ncbi:hypothetical protein GCM10010272_06960 [Streptomyces lateritius]|nr:hypothetical protein GCM10010272_06960 [Streptomyces lateritius]
MAVYETSPSSAAATATPETIMIGLDREAVPEAGPDVDVDLDMRNRS